MMLDECSLPTDGREIYSNPMCKGTVFVNQIPTVYMDAIGVMTGFGVMFISVTLNNSGPEFLPFRRRC